MIALGVAGSDLSTLILELSEYDTARFGPLWPSERNPGPTYQLEAFAASGGATEDQECPSEYVVFARGVHEAMRLFREITGDVVEPSAFDTSLRRSSPELDREDGR